jgi:hypothetical protein
LGRGVDRVRLTDCDDRWTCRHSACCYPAYEPLLTADLEHARARYAVGLSYPRDRRHVRAVMALENGLRRQPGGAFRTFVYSPAGMLALLRTRGFRLVGRRTTVTWSVDVYAKVGSSPVAVRPA